MALKAGRVGVSPTEVDEKGKIINTSTITVVDNLNSTSSTNALSAKQGKVLGDNLGGFKFRNNDGTPQYKMGNGDWSNFSSGDVTILDIPLEASPLFISTGGNISAESSPSEYDMFGYIDLTEYVGKIFTVLYYGETVNRYKATKVASTPASGVNGTFLVHNNTVFTTGAKSYAASEIVDENAPIICVQPTGTVVEANTITAQVVIFN